MDEQAAGRLYLSGPLSAHTALPNINAKFKLNRHFQTALLRIVERDGVVGWFRTTVIWCRWTLVKITAEVPLRYVVNHIDHICQLAGDSLRAGIGSDFDGGFGVQSVPPEIDTVADLQNLVSLLQARGYSETDAANILGNNWIARLKRDLPGK
jgi:membrane dipeptidase